MNKQAEYWKARCEAADLYINSLEYELSEQLAGGYLDVNKLNDCLSKYRSLVNTPEPEVCTHEHKVTVFLNGEYTICQECNAMIR